MATFDELIDQVRTEVNGNRNQKLSNLLCK